MKRIKVIIAIILLLCIGLGIFVLIKMRGAASSFDSDDVPVVENVTNIVTVQVGELKHMTLHHYVDGYGTVEAAPATANEPAAGGVLAAPIAGVVSKVNVIPGQHVEKGEVLAELNSSTATFNYVKTEVERQKKLLEQQNTSLKNMQDAEAQLLSLQVIAPVSGMVTSVNVKPGQAVDSTTIVAEVVDLNRLAVTAKIPAAQADKLQAGQEIQIQSDPSVTASLSFISPAVSADDATVYAWAALPSNSQLRPGQFVQFRIAADVHTNCLAAPVESVVTDDSGNSSIALVNGNQADQTQVKIGLCEGNWVEVEASGLKEGDRVVTIGAYGLPDKTQIQVVNPAEENSTTNSLQAQ